MEEKFMNNKKIIQDGINIQNTGNVSTFLSLKFIKAEEMTLTLSLFFLWNALTPLDM